MITLTYQIKQLVQVELVKYKPKFKAGDEVIVVKDSGGEGTPTDYYHPDDWNVGDTFIVDFVAVYANTAYYFASISSDDCDKSGVNEQALMDAKIMKTKLYKSLK